MNNTNTKLTNKDIVKDLSERIDSSIEELIASDDWTKYLSFVKGQHPYSWNNTFLIQFEGWLRGFNPSYVRGAKQWNAVGRNVKAGEKAIWILAPRIVWTCAEKGCSSSARLVWNKNLKKMVCTAKISHRTEKNLFGFMGVPVFDISQTEGDDIQFVTIKEKCEGATSQLWDHLCSIVEENDFTVSVEKASVDGFCDHKGNRIVISEDSSFGYQVKTLVHEIGHMLLHKDIDDYNKNRARYETEAEGIAWIVCQALGIHSEGDVYSFGYIKNWGGDESKKLVRESLGRIQKTATEILDLIESNLEK